MKEKEAYADMTPVEIRVAILRASTTQAEIARRVGCSRAMVCQIIDGKLVSDRIRRAIAEAIRIPVENIWRSYYLSRQITSDQSGSQRSAAC